MADSKDNFYRHMGVYGICAADNRMIVIRKILGPYTGKYDLPGGQLERMETLEQGITREFREETGYTVRQINPIGACDFTVTWTVRDGHTVKNLHHIALLYEVDVDSQELAHPIESFEGQDSNEAMWLDLDQVTSDNSSPLVVQAVNWIRTRTIPVASSSYDYRF
ncbi:NUDIX hydrolase [Paenibacillus sp. GCM10023250]|uniref:NUDIX hydrolase n=1 Tax=Paenibacillus sp. GCM10023250 TaxID=3252648 RepID=UPI00361DB2A9